MKMHIVEQIHAVCFWTRHQRSWNNG